MQPPNRRKTPSFSGRREAWVAKTAIRLLYHKGSRRNAKNFFSGDQGCATLLKN
jgi:hypothetical protein